MERSDGGALTRANSNLVNNPDPKERLALLRTVQRHLAPSGIALIERYDPDAGIDPTPTEQERDGITIRMFDIHRKGKLLYQKIECDAGARGRWLIDLEGARILSDDEILADLTAAGLRLLRWIDDRRRWLAAALAVSRRAVFPSARLRACVGERWPSLARRGPLGSASLRYWRVIPGSS